MYSNILPKISLSFNRGRGINGIKNGCKEAKTRLKMKCLFLPVSKCFFLDILKKENFYATYISSEKAHSEEGTRFPEAHGNKERTQDLSTSSCTRQGSFKRVKRSQPIEAGFIIICKACFYEITVAHE